MRLILICSNSQDGGTTVSRALLVTENDLVMQSLVSSASTQVPRRLRKQRGPPSTEASVHLFSLGVTYKNIQSKLVGDMDTATTQYGPLEAYEGLIDGLCAMACHPNINVRADAIGTGEMLFGQSTSVILTIFAAYHLFVSMIMKLNTPSHVMPG